MGSKQVSSGRQADTPLESHLRDDEWLYHLLTNRRVGVDRGGDGGAIRPGEDGSAYLGLTDSRIVVLVADPADRDRDFVASHQYADVAEASVVTESLTVCIEFETVDGRQWSFAARESAVDGARRYLSAACTDPAAPERAVLEDHCRALSTHLAAGEWDAFDDRAAATEAAVERYRRGTEGPSSSAAGPLGTLPRDVHCLVRDRHVLAGREQLVSARSQLDDADLELAYRRARTAYDQFERALERARRAGLATETAMVGLTAADDLADTTLGRLLAIGRDRSAEAANRDTREGRIADLEAALEIYGTVGALVTGDETLSDQAKERAREEATDVIETLVTARLDAAADHRQAADWEQAAGNDDEARRIAEDARAELEGALELATSYPPGDPDEIRARLDSLRAAFDLAD